MFKIKCTEQDPVIEMKSTITSLLYSPAKKEWKPKTNAAQEAIACRDSGQDDSSVFSEYLASEYREEIREKLPIPYKWNNWFLGALVIFAVICFPGCGNVDWQTYLLVLVPLGSLSRFLSSRNSQLFSQELKTLAEGKKYWLDGLDYPLFGYQELLKRCDKMDREDWIRSAQIYIQYDTEYTKISEDIKALTHAMNSRFYSPMYAERRQHWEHYDSFLIRGSINREVMVALIRFLNKISAAEGIICVIVAFDEAVVHIEEYVEQSGG